MNHADRQAPSLAVDVYSESELDGILGELGFLVFRFTDLLLVC